MVHKIKAGVSSLHLSEEQLALFHKLRLQRPSPSPLSTSSVQPGVKENLEGLRSRYPGINISFEPPGEKVKKVGGNNYSSIGKGTTTGKVTPVKKKKLGRSMVTVLNRKLLEQNPLVTVSVNQKKSLPVDQTSALRYWSDPRQVLHDAREEDTAGRNMKVEPNLKPCYDVERLLDYKNGKYLVKWVGYSEEDRYPEIQLTVHSCVLFQHLGACWQP